MREERLFTRNTPLVIFTLGALKSIRVERASLFLEGRKALEKHIVSERCKIGVTIYI